MKFTGSESNINDIGESESEGSQELTGIEVKLEKIVINFFQ